MFRPVGLEPLTSSSDPPHTSEHPIPTLQRALQVPNQLLHRPPVLPYLRFANRDFATWYLRFAYQERNTGCVGSELIGPASRAMTLVSLMGACRFNIVRNSSAACLDSIASPIFIHTLAMSISFAASGARMGIWHFHPNDPPTPTCFTRSLPFSLPTNTTPLHKFECVQNLGVHIQSIQSRPPCRKLLPFIDASRACSHAFCGECAWLRNVGYTGMYGQKLRIEDEVEYGPISVQFLVKCGVLQRCRPIFKEETVDESVLRTMRDPSSLKLASEPPSASSDPINRVSRSPLSPMTKCPLFSCLLRLAIFAFMLSPSGIGSRVASGEISSFVGFRAGCRAFFAVFFVLNLELVLAVRLCASGDCGCALDFPSSLRPNVKYFI
ncbi:hypothetical protein KC347_g113 [Hortaea werneckii]|nr:hypothetical protein KC347_g113 [Hortaea werneckii]